MSQIDIQYNKKIVSKEKPIFENDTQKQISQLSNYTSISGTINGLIVDNSSIKIRNNTISSTSGVGIVGLDNNNIILGSNNLSVKKNMYTNDNNKVVTTDKNQNQLEEIERNFYTNNSQINFPSPNYGQNSAYKSSIFQYQPYISKQVINNGLYSYFSDIKDAILLDNIYVTVSGNTVIQLSSALNPQIKSVEYPFRDFLNNLPCDFNGYSITINILSNSLDRNINPVTIKNIVGGKLYLKFNCPSGTVYNDILNFQNCRNIFIVGNDLNNLSSAIDIGLDLRDLSSITNIDLRDIEQKNIILSGLASTNKNNIDIMYSYFQTHKTDSLSSLSNAISSNIEQINKFIPYINLTNSLENSDYNFDTNIANKSIYTKITIEQLQNIGNIIFSIGNLIETNKNLLSTAIFNANIDISDQVHKVIYRTTHLLSSQFTQEINLLSSAYTELLNKYNPILQSLQNTQKNKYPSNNMFRGLLFDKCFNIILKNLGFAQSYQKKYKNTQLDLQQKYYASVILKNSNALIQENQFEIHKNGLISVGICAYNSKAYLKDCIFKGYKNNVQLLGFSTIDTNEKADNMQEYISQQTSGQAVNGYLNGLYKHLHTNYIPVTNGIPDGVVVGYPRIINGSITDLSVMKEMPECLQPLSNTSNIFSNYNCYFFGDLVGFNISTADIDNCSLLQNFTQNKALFDKPLQLDNFSMINGLQITMTSGGTYTIRATNNSIYITAAHDSSKNIYSAVLNAYDLVSILAGNCHGYPSNVQNFYQNFVLEKSYISFKLDSKVEKYTFRYILESHNNLNLKFSRSFSDLKIYYYGIPSNNRCDKFLGREIILSSVHSFENKIIKGSEQTGFSRTKKSITISYPGQLKYSVALPKTLGYYYFYADTVLCKYLPGKSSLLNISKATSNQQV